MAKTIFHLDSTNRLVPLKESSYDSEDLLQALLQDFPDLLAGDEINEQSPRRWLLIQREMGVADSESSGARWSVDHLFVDQDATPTLVEVKRSSDTRIRREVVGQILEYAANATKYWPVEKIRETFEARCERDEVEADAEIAQLLGAELDVESFWSDVADNLRLGRLRLLFVADRVPRELRRIVEFLNEQMVRTEVLAVEVRQFVGTDGRKTLVPKVLGQTAAAEGTKGGSRKPRATPWNPESLLANLRRDGRTADVAAVERILAWADDRGLKWGGGKGATRATIILELGGSIAPISIYEAYVRCVLHIQFNWMGPKFESVEARRPIAEAFNQIPGVELDVDRPYPGIGFALLESEEAWKALFKALDSTIERFSRA